MAPAPVLRRCKGGTGRSSRDCFVSLPEGCSQGQSACQAVGGGCQAVGGGFQPGRPLYAALKQPPSPPCLEGGRHKVSGGEDSSSLAPCVSLPGREVTQYAGDAETRAPLRFSRSDSATASSAAGRADANQEVQLTSSASEGLAARRHVVPLPPAFPVGAGAQGGGEGGSVAKEEGDEEASLPSSHVILDEDEGDVALHAANPGKPHTRRPRFGSSSTFSCSRGSALEWDWSDEDTVTPGNAPLGESEPQKSPEDSGDPGRTLSLSEQTRGGPSSEYSEEEEPSLGGLRGGPPLMRAAPSDTSCSLTFLGLTGLTEEELVEALLGRQAAAAAESLRVLAKRGPQHAQGVVEAGAVRALTQLLLADDVSAVEHASAALLHLGSCGQTRAAVLSEPALVKGLVHVLGSHWPTAQANAVATLRSVAAWAPGSVRRELAMSGGLSLLVKLLGEGEEAAKKDCAACLLALSRCKGCRAAAVQAGVVPVLCTVLKEGTCTVDEEAAGVFLALSRDEGGASALLQGGAIPALAALLGTGATEGSREHALGALLAVASRGGECAEAVAWAVAGAGFDKMAMLENESITGTASLQQKASELWRLLQRSSMELKTGPYTSNQQEVLEASV